MKYILTFLLVLDSCLLVETVESKPVPERKPEKTEVKYPAYRKITKRNISIQQDAVLMAAIAWNEIRNGHPMERWLIMEATWNRVANNYNNNGSTLAKQVLAPKQFPLPYSQLYFNPANPYMQENYKMALQIIAGERIAETTIYSWSTSRDKGNHHKYITRKAIKTYGLTQHTFG